MICIYDLRLLVWGLGLYRDQGIEVGDLPIYLFFWISGSLAGEHITERDPLSRGFFTVQSWLDMARSLYHYNLGKGILLSI